MTRPHNLRVAPEGTSPWRGTVSFHRTVGALIEYHVDMPDGTTIQVAAMRQERASPLQAGAAVSLSVIDPSYCAVYPI